MSFSIYDILTEAEDDNQNANNDAPAEGENNNNEDTGGDDAAGGGDEEDTTMDDIDNSLDSIGGDEGDDAGGADTGGGDSGDTGGTTDMGSGDDEPVEANTDMFGSLSAEEQKMKIMELKKQYSQLFDSCDDMIDKISTIKTTEVTMVPISRMTNILMNLKDYITDYLYNQFATMSYYENDVTFNRFLAIFKSISNILNDISRYNSENS